MTRAAVAFLTWIAVGGCSPGDTSDDEPADAAIGDGASVPDADAGGPCAADRDCDDGIACTIDHCEDAGCTHAPCPDCCAEGFACIVGLGCSGAPEPCEVDGDCADDVRCTLDRCRDRTECEHVPQSALCPDGEACLAALGCIPAPPEECTDDADCFGDRVCLGTWDCDAEFGCQFVTPTDCADDDPCTLDLCDEEAGGCVRVAQDADQDGAMAAACGGDDCDDEDPAVHPDAVEACNDLDDDCDREIDEGFDCDPGDEETCTTACDSAGTRTCGDDCTFSACIAPEESCNGVDDDCNDGIDEGFACLAGTSGECPTICGSTGSRLCLGNCEWDVCAPPDETCNGADDDCDSACDEDFTCCAGESRDCTLLGFDRGTALCREDCRFWDTSTCSWCGDDHRDLGEECDGDDLAGQDCTTLGLGFDGGTLACTDDCSFDTRLCTGFDPTGLYILVPAPSYSCAFGIGVNFTMATATFTDSGVALVVQGAPCPMTGDTATDGSFTVTCSLLGGCDETYTLTGTFTDTDTWQGDFTATYSGNDCFDCTDQSWLNIVGTR